MASGAPRGFTPAASQTGGGTLRSNRYLKDTQAAVHIGDAVVLVSGAVTTWVTAQVANYLGIVKACYSSTGKPLTFNQPGQGPCLTSGQAGYVDVYDDPNLVLTVECSAPVSAQLIGTAADPIHVSGNSATGVSRQGIAFNGGAAAFVVESIAGPTGNVETNNRVNVVPRQGIYKPLA